MGKHVVQQRQLWKWMQDFGAWFIVEHTVGLGMDSRKVIKDVERSDLKCQMYNKMSLVHSWHFDFS